MRGARGLRPVRMQIKEADHLPKMDRGAVGSVDPYCLLVLGMLPSTFTEP